MSYKINEKVFIIAEVGLNHNGDFELAKKSIYTAVNSGVDAVKFQNYKTEDFIFDKSLTYTYKNNGKEITETMWDMCKRCELKREWIPALKKICDEAGIEFLSTPTSEEGVNDLVDAGVKMMKNGSDYLNHLPLLKYMGSTGLPVIISTGMADRAEIEDAVNAVRAGDKSRIVLLHCTSSYPTASKDVNLSRMDALRKEFDVPVGFSDHTIGVSAAVQAVTMGATILEKHFTLDKNMPGPDHWFSASPEEMKQYVDAVREAEKRMGKEDICPSESEKDTLKEFKLSLIASKDIAAGKVIEVDDFVISKPGKGLPPKDAANIVGKEVLKQVNKGTPLLWEHFVER